MNFSNYLFPISCITLSVCLNVCAPTCVCILCHLIHHIHPHMGMLHALLTDGWYSVGCFYHRNLGEGRLTAFDVTKDMQMVEKPQLLLQKEGLLFSKVPRSCFVYDDMSLCFLGMKINFKLRVDVFKGLQDNVLETLRCGFLLETTEPKASVLWRLS